jgi:hypothetical protein
VSADVLSRAEWEYLYALAAGHPIEDGETVRGLGRQGKRFVCWCDWHERWELEAAGLVALGRRPVDSSLVSVCGDPTYGATQ